MSDEDLRKIASHLELEFPVTVEEVTDRVRETVQDAVKKSDYDEIESLDQLRRAVCDHQSIQIEYIEEDEHLGTLAKRHDHIREDFAGTLRDCFQCRNQRGAVYNNPMFPEHGREYLAVVDTRGPKEQAAEFTLWHEIAHVLLKFLSKDDESGAESGARAEIERTKPKAAEESIGEMIVDRVASMLVYWDPLWAPDVDEELRQYGGLTFEVIENIRQRYTPRVSFYSCAIQCVKAFHRPCLLVSVAKKMKPSQRRQWESQRDQLGLKCVEKKPPPEKKLRLDDCIASEESAIEDPMELWSEMRVPASSVLREVFEADGNLHRSEFTNQSEWETTTQGALPNLPLYVEAKQFGVNTLGLIQPNWNEVTPEELESGKLV